MVILSVIRSYSRTPLWLLATIFVFDLLDEYSFTVYVCTPTTSVLQQVMYLSYHNNSGKGYIVYNKVNDEVLNMQ